MATTTTTTKLKLLPLLLVFIGAWDQMEWTDRHYRFMMRHITRRTQLWTEMVVDDTVRRFLTIRVAFIIIYCFHGHHCHPISFVIGCG